MKTDEEAQSDFRLILRGWEILPTSKNAKGESVRKDAKFDKQYLEGKYGADPYLRRIIDWGKVND